MEFLRINSSKLKITLTAEELDRYGIQERDGEFDARSVREIVADILEDAGAGGFCKQGEKLLVQLYPMPKGGAELFITRLSAVGERERRAVEFSGSVNTYQKERAVFVFECLDDLLRASRLPQLSGKRADLYLGSDGRYLLVTDEERFSGLSPLDILLEFSVRRSFKEAAPRPEWDKLLATGNAIELLSAL